MKTRFAMAVAVVLLATLGLVSVSSSASARSNRIGPTPKVPNSIVGGHDRCNPALAFCLAPGLDVIGDPTSAACQPFPDGNEWQNVGADGNGVPISWTYANGGNACVRATYLTVQTALVCNFWFYVPKGFATANIIFGWWDTSGTKHLAEVVDESSADGWLLLTLNNPQNRGAANVQRIDFQDNDGQTFPKQMGWGSDSSHGIKQTC